MSFIRQFQDAVIGFSGYDRLLRSKKSAFGYLTLLLLLVMIINAVIETVNTREAVTATNARIEAGPTFELRGGEFRFDGPMPYRIDLGMGQMIIDTTGQTAPEALRGDSFQILITRTHVYQTQPWGEVTVTPLAMYGDVVMTKRDVQGLLSMAPNFVWIIFVVIFLAQLAFKMLDGWILSRVGLAFAARAGRRIPPEVAWNGALYAMTVPILLQWIVPGFSVVTPWGLAIWWTVAVVYVAGGLRAYLVGQSG